MTRLIRRYLLLAVILAITGLTLTACGGGDEATSTPTRSGPTLGPALEQQLRDFLGKWAAATTKITYAFHSVAGSDTKDLVITYYQQGPNARQDTSRPDADTQYLKLADTGYACAKYPTTGGSCAVITADEAGQTFTGVPLVQPLTQEGIDTLLQQAISLEAAPEQQIAGQDATCIKITLPDGQLTRDVTGCFSPDGLLLSEASTGSFATFTMTATGLAEPDASDFEPPYPVVTPQPTPAASSSP